MDQKITVFLAPGPRKEKIMSPSSDCEAKKGNFTQSNAKVSGRCCLSPPSRVQTGPGPDGAEGKKETPLTVSQASVSAGRIPGRGFLSG